jgi:uncharacterized membrane protein
VASPLHGPSRIAPGLSGLDSTILPDKGEEEVAMHPDPSTRLRTFVKALLWEVISFIITLAISWAIIGDLGEATWLTGLLFVIKVTLLFSYERAWHSVRWGKVDP